MNQLNMSSRLVYSFSSPLVLLYWILGFALITAKPFYDNSKNVVFQNGQDAQSNTSPMKRNVFQVPIYYINMDAHVQRRLAMESHLSALHVPYFQRISALTTETCNLLMVESPCLRVNFLDIAIMCSHLQALHTAVNDPHPLAQNSDYFLVLEDDVRFLWAIDFDDLIAQAPTHFGSLQLMLSHRPHVEETWERFIETEGEELFVFRPRNSSVWSAQAILYRKSAIQAFVAASVSKDRQGRLGFKMINSFQYDKLLDRPAGMNSKRNNNNNKNNKDLISNALPLEKLLINPFRPVIACECLFADMFLYAMARPAYMTALPLLNSAAQGMKSTIHQDHVAFHIHGFLATEIYFTKMILHLQEEMMEIIKEKVAQLNQNQSQAMNNENIKWNIIAESIVTSVLPSVYSSNKGNHTNKARPAFLVHPLLPATHVMDTSGLSNYHQTSSANYAIFTLSEAVQGALHAHLLQSLAPTPLVTIDTNALYYNITQWHEQALAHPLESWVFARIYGDLKKGEIDPHLKIYLREEPNQHHKRNNKHYGPTNT